jgi:GT2 family glycosyltransferase
VISYVIPTRQRHARLRDTLARLGALGDHAAAGGAEVVVVDNASPDPVELSPGAAGPLRVTVLRMTDNIGAAARNEGARAADPASAWVVMLDDDSYPLDASFAARLARQPADVAAVSADISLSPGPTGARGRERGGLPEVFVGCGVALRRDAFLELGGYDPEFDYYVEEYDLAARLLASGRRVAFDPGFRVEHAKDATNRDIDLVMARLVRNSAWVAQRYVPEEDRRAALREVRRRYAAIAAREHALPGYAAGLAGFRWSRICQKRTPLSRPLYDRFTGLQAAREALARERERRRFWSAAVVDEGKHAWVVHRALAEMGVRVVNEWDGPDVLVIGSMSPGPMLDATEKRIREGRCRVIAPWTPVNDIFLPRADRRAA